MIMSIDCLITADALMDKMENRKPGSSGSFGPMFED
jgi:hypothetical protein